MLKKKIEETVSLLAAYAERLKQMDLSHATLNQTINDSVQIKLVFGSVLYFIF